MENDDEARFKLQIFALFQPKNLGDLLRQNSSIQANILLNDFARFLAAYYLDFNFSEVFLRLKRLSHQHQKDSINNPVGKLPNLLQWSQWAECENSPSTTECINYPKNRYSNKKDHYRYQIAQLLPPEYTPNFALKLLLRTDHLLEAIFFCDYFNDFRTSVILRYLIDSCCENLNLFVEHVNSVLIDHLLKSFSINNSTHFDRPNDTNSLIDVIQNLSQRIERHIDAIVQLDVVFSEKFADKGLLNEFLILCSKELESEFFQLLYNFNSEDNNNITLFEVNLTETKLSTLSQHNSPFYTIPADFSYENDENFSRNKMYFCIKSLMLTLNRANRLHSLIGYFALWVKKQRKDTTKLKTFESELPYLLEADFYKVDCDFNVDPSLECDFMAFQRILTVVLGMDLRDKLILLASRKETINDLEYDRLQRIAKLQNSLNILTSCRIELDTIGEQDQNRDGLIWISLNRWLACADEEGIHPLMLFMQFAQENNSNTERFLSALNNQSRPKWKSTFMAQVYPGRDLMHQNQKSEIQLLSINELFTEDNKFKVNSINFMKIQFLAQQLINVPMFDEDISLIQISLKLNPSEICSPIIGNSDLNYLYEETQNNSIDNINGVQKCCINENSASTFKSKLALRQEELTFSTQKLGEILQRPKSAKDLREKIQTTLKRLTLLDQSKAQTSRTVPKVIEFDNYVERNINIERPLPTPYTIWQLIEKRTRTPLANENIKNETNIVTEKISANINKTLRQTRKYWSDIGESETSSNSTYSTSSTDSDFQNKKKMISEDMMEYKKMKMEDSKKKKRMNKSARVTRKSQATYSSKLPLNSKSSINDPTEYEEMINANASQIELKPDERLIDEIEKIGKKIENLQEDFHKRDFVKDSRPSVNELKKDEIAHQSLTRKNRNLNKETQTISFVDAIIQVNESDLWSNLIPLERQSNIVPENFQQSSRLQISCDILTEDEIEEDLISAKTYSKRSEMTSPQESKRSEESIKISDKSEPKIYEVDERIFDREVQIPKQIERMDFSQLHSDEDSAKLTESGTELNSGAKTITKKKYWKEIEIYPRETKNLEYSQLQHKRVDAIYSSNSTGSDNTNIIEDTKEVNSKNWKNPSYVSEHQEYLIWNHSNWISSPPISAKTQSSRPQLELPRRFKNSPKRLSISAKSKSGNSNISEVKSSQSSPASQPNEEKAINSKTNRYDSGIGLDQANQAHLEIQNPLILFSCDLTKEQIAQLIKSSSCL